MTLGRWIALASAAALVLLAAYLPHLDYDDLVGLLWDDEHKTGTVTWTRRALVGVALVIAGGVAYRWMKGEPDKKRRWRAVWFALAAIALLAAIYLPHLRADDLVGELWGTAAEDSDKADAVTWIRWALVVLAVLIVVVAVRGAWLELSVVVLAVLLLVAAAAATGALLSRLDRPAEVKEMEAAFDRGFALPPEKVQQVTRDLKRDRCVTIVLVKPLERADGDDAVVLAHEPATYSARLISEVKAGKPAAPVEIELGRAARPQEFASDLMTATAAFVLSTQSNQDAGTAATAGCG